MGGAGLLEQASGDKPMTLRYEEDRVNLLVRIDLPGGGWINLRAEFGEHADRLVDCAGAAASRAGSCDRSDIRTGGELTP